jgi:hypothetical protein
MNDGLSLSGHISWILTGKDGSTKKGETPNVITNYGKEWFSNILAGASPNSLWLGAGSSIGLSGTVSASDTKLFQEVPVSGYGYSRAAVSKSHSNNTVAYSAYLAGTTVAVKIRELGLFPNNSVGSTFLIAHQLVGEIPIGPTYASLQVTWIISLN